VGTDVEDGNYLEQSWGRKPPWYRGVVVWVKSRGTRIGVIDELGGDGPNQKGVGVWGGKEEGTNSQTCSKQLVERTGGGCP